jgi:hypothetical protein
VVSVFFFPQQRKGRTRHDEVYRFVWQGGKDVGGIADDRLPARGRKDSPLPFKGGIKQVFPGINVAHCLLLDSTGQRCFRQLE